MPVQLKNVLVCDAVDQSCISLLESNGFNVSTLSSFPYSTSDYFFSVVVSPPKMCVCVCVVYVSHPNKFAFALRLFQATKCIINVSDQPVFAVLLYPWYTACVCVGRLSRYCVSVRADTFKVQHEI